MSRTGRTAPVFFVPGLLLAALFAAAPAPAAPAAPAAAPAKPPVAERKPATEHVFGRTLTDDYQWLENWSDPAVKSWVEGENAYTRGVLDRIPSRTAIRDRVAQLSEDVAPRYYNLVHRGATIFALKDPPPKNQPMLVALTSLDDLSSERLVVDPNAIDTTGGTSIDFFEPSLDGARVAVSLSKGGTESGDVHFYETATGQELPDVLPRVNGGTAGGDIAWTPDGSAVWYTRYPSPDTAPADSLDFDQQVWFHTLGQPLASDTYVMGKELPRIAEITFQSSDDGQWLLVAVKNGDGGEIGWWLRGPDGEIKPIASFTDRIVGAQFGTGTLYLLSRRHSPMGEVVRMPLDWPDLANATRIVPAGDRAIDEIHLAGNELCVIDQLGGPMGMRRFSLEGRSLGEVPVPPLTAVSGFVSLQGGGFAIALQSYTTPEHWERFDAASDKLVPTALAMRSNADFSGIEVRRAWATSKDGTKIPMNVLVKKGFVLDGRSPALLYGYGGYGISESPNFRPERLLWLEQGGVYAVANIRGGREYGEAWHEAGKLTKKQNVFDDFAACAQALVDQKFTSKDRLVIQGGSNGGLLMGAEMTQHPDLFSVVISEVGVYDMLLSERTPNGVFNTTEYGTIADSAQFRALMDYSPLQHVRAGVQYPATLLTTGVNDPRVAPANSFKFAAALQATGTKKPVLLRTSMTTGHIGVPLNARNERVADIYSFIFSQLGLSYRPLAKPAP